MDAIKRGKNMVWSKLKKSINELITPELKKRIDIHCTRYHKAHDDQGEAWITIDKEKIIGGGYYHWLTSKMPIDLREKSTNAYDDEFYKPIISDEYILKIMKAGIHETSHITKNLFNYINTPFDISLKSNNPIFKAFSIIDKRLGKKRFQEIKIYEDDHILVKAFYDLRKGCFSKSD